MSSTFILGIRRHAALVAWIVVLVFLPIQFAGRADFLRGAFEPAGAQAGATESDEQTPKRNALERAWAGRQRLRGPLPHPGSAGGFRPRARRKARARRAHARRSGAPLARGATEGAEADGRPAPDS